MTDIRQKYKQLVQKVGLPRIIIVAFFIVLCITAVGQHMDLEDIFSNLLLRVGMNGILVLAMVPAIQCGIGLNFGLPLGIVGGLVGGLVSIEAGLEGFWALLVAIAIGIIISTVVGIFYGMLLNRVKGSEMTVSTYVGFSIIAFMCMMWIFLPFRSGEIVWPLTKGARNTIDLTSSFGGFLTNLWAFKIGNVKVPTGLLLFFALCCFLIWLFMRSKAGVSMSAAGANSRFAAASGIEVNKMRILGTAISTMLGSISILAYAQSFGFLQLYNAPMNMSFSAVAAVLIGGASIRHAKISHVIIGVILFQGLMSVGPPVANKIMTEGNLSEVARLIISNGIILYALTKAVGGEKSE